jgi:hypothetical protein
MFRREQSVGCDGIDAKNARRGRRLRLNRNLRRKARYECELFAEGTAQTEDNLQAGGLEEIHARH